MARCCGSSSCGCNVQGVGGILVTGTGSPTDPFVISGNMMLVAEDNTTFDLTFAGNGSLENPYRLSVNFAATASVDDFPDVDTGGKTAGQVMGWNGTIWTAVDPTTLPAGAVTHDTSLEGDGSGALPLAVVEDPDRLLATTPAGLGLSDEGMNTVVRHFSDDVDRAYADPPPSLNALSTLESAPGEIDYWTGGEWLPTTGQVRVAERSMAILQLSGPWDGQPIEVLFAQITTTTDASGRFTVLSSAELSASAGVMGVNVQPIGAIGWQGVIEVTNGEILATAYSMTGGKLANQQIQASITASTY